MEELIIQDLLGQLIPKMQESGIKKVYLCTRYTESGSSTTEGNYLDEVGNIHVGLIASSKKLLREYQNQTKTDPVRRFNTVEFEVYRDGSYQAHYYWDEGEDKDQKLKTAEVFPIWLHERFLQFLFEVGYGDIENWQKGTFKVKIDKEKNVQAKATLYNKDQKFDAQRLLFPQAVYEAILSHYEITNNGILSDTWQKWNTLLIQTRRMSVDLERDVEYRLEDWLLKSNIVLWNKDEIVEIFDKLTPRASHTLKLDNGKLKLVDADGVEWVEDITGTQVIAKGGNKPFNKFLDGFPPMKSFEYVIDGNFKYKTDELGRVEKITIENLELNPNRVRDEYQQGLTKGLKDGKPTDNGGHMAGNQFNGPSEQINYHSQDWVSNQSGDWYKMEQELKQLRLDNPNATIKVEIVPEFSGTSKRPDRFDVDVEINGVAIPVPYRISNP